MDNRSPNSKHEARRPPKSLQDVGPRVEQRALAGPCRRFVDDHAARRTRARVDADQAAAYGELVQQRGRRRLESAIDEYDVERPLGARARCEVALDDADAGASRQRLARELRRAPINSTETTDAPI